jgi:hypothetical protein
MEAAPSSAVLRRPIAPEARTTRVITCPVRLSGSIRGLKVREERFLADRKLAKAGSVVDKLLRACQKETAGPGLYGCGGAKIDWNWVQLEHDGTTPWWSLSRAWPVRFVAGEWDNESDENVIESVMLTFDFFELIQ